MQAYTRSAKDELDVLARTLLLAASSRLRQRHMVRTKHVLDFVLYMAAIMYVACQVGDCRPARSWAAGMTSSRP
jgi:hypothetical protein